MVLTILRWGTFLGFVAAIGYYWVITGGHLTASRDAANHITLTAVVWAATLFLRRPPPDGRTLRGSARPASRRDLADFLQSPRRAERPGGLLPGAYLVGRFGRRAVALTPKQTTEHVLLVGPSGTGKSSTQYLANAALATGSIVVADPKGELWRMTSGYHGASYRFAPGEPEASASCNWVPLCREKRTADLLAQAVIQPRSGGEQFFKQAAVAFVSALFTYTALAMKTATPATCYGLLTEGGPALLDRFAESEIPACELLANTYRANDRTRDSVLAEVVNQLGWLDDPAVARFTSASARAPRFERLLHEPLALYWVLHERDVERLRPLTALFFTLLLDQLTAPSAAPAQGAVPVTFLWDEFGSAGTIPGMATTIAVARGRGIGLVLGLQALAQLDEHYGPAAAKTIKANAATKLFLHGLEPEDFEYASRLCGETTIRHRSVSRTGGGWGVRDWAGRETTSEQFVGRRLFTGDELRRMRQDELLMVVGNRPPARVRKRRWERPPRAAATTPLGPALAWRP